MLNEIMAFFGAVTPQGAVALLLVGLLTGFGLHDVIVAAVNFWYAGQHVGPPKH